MGSSPSIDRAEGIFTPCLRFRPSLARRCSQNFHAENVVAKKLGRGAYASVYAVCRTPSEEPKYAAKVISLRLSDRRGSRIRERMVLRELQITERVAMMQSRFVVNFFESFVDDHIVYMLMERCDETLLQALVSFDDTTEDTYRPLLYGMLSGLAVIHSAGVVHLDVKPDNFMCCGLGEARVVKLCDFGLAQAVSTPEKNELFGANGTAPFMAPEMVGKSRYNAKVDLWSVGVVVYLLFFGHFPYMPRLWTSEAMKAAIRLNSPEPAFAPKVRGHQGGDLADANSEAAQQLVRRLLERCPEERPSAKEAMHEDFFRGAACVGHAASLKPMLHSAELCGAFGSSRCDPESMPSDLDMQVAALQVLHGHDSVWSRQTTATLGSHEAPAGSESTFGDGAVV